MTQQQSNMIEPILETIKNDDIREFAKVLVDDLPSYIWEVGASSSGKYHPKYSLGQGGLMRHSIAVVKFLNFFFELEQYNTQFTEREMDLMRVAALCHDGRKSGEQADYEKSKYTKFSHPTLMANAIRSFDGKYLNHDEIDFIANCIESHMGQWNIDKKTTEVLPKPQNIYQQMVHLADYLASRKCLIMEFEEVEKEVPTTNLPELDTYILPFGKFKNQKLVDVARKNPNYIAWCKENITSEPIRSLLKMIDTQEDEI